jgi:hypothetical protein
MSHTVASLVRNPEKASFEPSGDHAGARAHVLMTVKPSVPSALMTAMRGPAPTLTRAVNAKVIRVPSGDQLGPACPTRYPFGGSATSTRGFDPSASTTAIW